MRRSLLWSANSGVEAACKELWTAATSGRVAELWKSRAVAVSYAHILHLATSKVAEIFKGFASHRSLSALCESYINSLYVSACFCCLRLTSAITFEIRCVLCCFVVWRQDGILLVCRAARPLHESLMQAKTWLGLILQMQALYQQIELIILLATERMSNIPCKTAVGQTVGHVISGLWDLEVYQIWC